MTTTPSGVMVVPAPRFADVLAADLEGRVLPALVIESGVEVDLDDLGDLDDLDEPEQAGSDLHEGPDAAVLPLIAAASPATRPDGDGQALAARLLMSVVGDFARAALASAGVLSGSVPELRSLVDLLDEIDTLTSNGVSAVAGGGGRTT